MIAFDLSGCYPPANGTSIKMLIAAWNLDRLTFAVMMDAGMRTTLMLVATAGKLLGRPWNRDSLRQVQSAN
jgi:hypothetical protein